MLAEVALGHTLAAIGELVRGGVVEADAEVARAKIGGDIRGELQRLLRGDLRGDADRLHVREFTRTPCETAGRMCVGSETQPIQPARTPAFHRVTRASH